MYIHIIYTCISACTKQRSPCDSHLERWSPSNHQAPTGAPALPCSYIQCFILFTASSSSSLSSVFSLSSCKPSSLSLSSSSAHVNNPHASQETKALPSLGPNRVAGTLAVTRAFGDWYLKEEACSTAPYKGKVPYITAGKHQAPCMVCPMIYI